MRRAGPPRSAHPGICHVFYETRVLMGRDFTLQRFAREVLDGEVEAVMLGYIEKGERLPSESLVRRLAEIRREAPDQLLAVLARDRMLRALGKELRKFLQLPSGGKGARDAQLAISVTHALTQLPDDRSWVDIEDWQQSLAEATGDASAADELAKVQAALAAEGLVEIKKGRVRRSGHHYEPRDQEQRLALAVEYSVLFLKGLIDRVAFPDEDRGTYLRNHFLHISPDKIPALQADLDETLRALARKYGEERGEDTEFLNILTTATHL